jgi:hypothetical protein
LRAISSRFQPCSAAVSPVLHPDGLVRNQDEPHPVNEGTHLAKRATTCDARQHGLARCQRPYPVATTRLVVFRLDVTVKDFVLVDDVADMSWLWGLSEELGCDLESR